MSHLRRFIGNRRGHRRVRARLNFTLSLADPRVNNNGSRRLPTLNGHTLDISTTGVALIVPAIRIGEHYLAGSDRHVHLKLELPSGPVEMKLTTVRYESLDESDEETGYLIGARIIEMADADRKAFGDHIARLLSRPPTN